MTKAELAKIQRYVDRCTDALGLDRVKVSSRTTQQEYAGDRQPPLAAVGKDHRKQVTMWVTERFLRMPPQLRRELVAHELIHVEESRKWALVDRWRDAGQITARQYADYAAREERQVLRLERAFAQLIPEWRD